MEENKLEEINITTEDEIIGKEPKRTNNAVVMLIAMGLFTKVFGFLREIVFANYYGTNDLADVYKVASTIPLMILVFIGTGFDTGFIPIFNSVNSSKGKEAANRYMNKVVSLVVLITLGVSLVVALFPKPFIFLFASGFSGEKMELAMKLVRLSIFCIIFAMLRYIFMPYLQIRENFVIPALVGIPMNIVHILSFPLGYFFGPMYLALGLVLAELVQLAFVYPFAVKEGFKLKPELDFKDRNIQKLFVLAAPIILSVAVTQINVLIDQNMASRVEPLGGIAALNYAYRLNGFVQGIFIFSVISVLYPRVSKLFVANDEKGIVKMLTESIVIISVTVAPCMVGLLIFSEQITKFVFGRGAFDARSVMLTSQAMYFYAFSLLAFGFREILIRVFYSKNDTKTPMVNSIIAVCLNIVLNLTLSYFMGLRGLALATSISNTVSTILLAIALRNKGFVKLNWRQIGIKVGKVLLASIIMGIVSYFVEKKLVIVLGAKIGLLASIFIAAVVYFIAILLIRLEEIDEIVVLIKNKLNRKLF